ncbi:MAG: hypothetical protein RIR00_2448, partial [Pseudomonadota bacterium]
PARKPAAATPAAPQPLKELNGQVVFQVLLGELALQRNEIDLATNAYADLSLRTRDPKVLARTVEVANYARRFDIALDAARMWTEIEPESATARQALSHVLIQSNRIDELAPQITQLLEKDKANLADNLTRLYRSFSRYPDKAAVLRLVQQVVQPYRALPEAHFAIATAAVAAGNMPLAGAEIRQSLELRPDWEQAALFEAQLLARQSEVDAISQLNHFLAANPKAKEARLALARLLIAGKRYEESRKQYDQLLNDSPDNPEVVYPVAMLALQQGDIATGEKLLLRLLTLDFPEKGTLHFFLGQIYEEQGKLAAAAEHYRQVSGGEQHFGAQTRMARIAARQGQLDVALAALHGIQSKTPHEKTQVLLTEAEILRDAKQAEAAYQLLNTALQAQPDQPELLYDTALLAERIGKDAEMEKLLRRLIELQPEHAHALNALGYAWTERNIHLDQAHELIAKAVKLAPDDPFIMDSLGWVQFRLGKPQEALKTLEKALSIKSDPEIAAHLGEVLWSLGRKDDARKIWDDARRKAPDNSALLSTIEKFQRP